MTSTIRPTERRPLVFDAPFGDGDDRHAHVRAASAIVPFVGGWLVAQDDSNFAAHIVGARVTPVRLFAREGADTFSERAGTKARKPDIECGVALENGGAPAAVFFGSGSTAARTRAVMIGIDAGAPVVLRIADMARLYDAARSTLALPSDALNIEGACVVGSVVRFFQRGNAGLATACVNASFDVRADTLLSALLRDAQIESPHISNVRRYELGCLHDAPLGFGAAAAFADGRVVFAASAEASPSTYDDGECAGSILGLLDANQNVAATWVVDTAPDRVKIEGVGIDGIDQSALYIVAVTDSDDPSAPSELLRFRLVEPPPSVRLSSTARQPNLARTVRVQGAEE